jgi:hypothetical protein
MLSITNADFLGHLLYSFNANVLNKRRKVHSGSFGGLERNPGNSFPVVGNSFLIAGSSEPPSPAAELSGLFRDLPFEFRINRPLRRRI